MPSSPGDQQPLWWGKEEHEPEPGAGQIQLRSAAITEEEMQRELHCLVLLWPITLRVLQPRGLASPTRGHL